MPSYDGNADTIPKDPATDTPYLRFNWNDACTAPSNQVAFKRWVDYSHTSGRSILPQATGALSEVMHCHLVERCAAKYAYVRRRLQEYRNVSPQLTVGAAHTGVAGAMEGNADQGVATGSTMVGSTAVGDTTAGDTTVGGNTVTAGSGPRATASANQKQRGIFNSRAKGVSILIYLVSQKADTHL